MREQVDPVTHIIEQLAGRCTQSDVALSYANVIMLRGAIAPWKAINALIVARWPKGLSRVKKMAWVHVDLMASLREGESGDPPISDGAEHAG